MTKRARNSPEKRRWFVDMRPIDYALSFVGLCLGTAAAVFPWHVYLNPGSYGPPRMEFSRNGELRSDEIAAIAAGNPMFDFESGKFIANYREPLIVDPVITGEINRDPAAEKRDLRAFPGNGTRFRVFAVSAGRALVGDSEGVYLVRRTSRLPDGTIVKAIDRDDQGWRILTSQEKVLRPNG
jgi:hypothetical protein